MTTTGDIDSPATMAAPPPIPSADASAARVEGSRGCIHCAYDLNGLAIAGNCPECGRPISDSLRGLLLQFASAEYIATIRQGHSFILNGILLQIVVMVVMIGLTAAGVAPNVPFLAQAAGLVVGAIILLGYIKATELDPGFVGTESPTDARNIVRIAAIVQIVLSLVSLVLEAASGVTGAAAGPLGLVVSLIALVAWAAQYFAMMRYERWLASRVPDQWIIKRTKTYYWLLPVLTTVGLLLIGLGPLVALVLFWNLLDRMRKHLKAIEASGKPAVLKGM